MKIDPKSPIPKYHQLKSIIRQFIEKGKIKPNQKIPSEADLMTTYKVSRYTIRQAIGQLVNEGWLYREQGIGTFCAKHINSNSERALMIGVISVVVSNYIFPSIIHGIDDVVHPKGYSIILGSANHQIEKEATYIENMIAKKVDGLIIEPTRSAVADANIEHFHKLKRMGIPFVMIDSYLEELDSSYVCVDDVLGGYLAADYLIKLGHRRIGIIYKSEHIPAIKRLQGYKKALRNYKIKYCEELIKSFTSPEEENPTFPLVKELLQLKNPPTAIFCYNDQIAFQTCRALKKLGFRVPDDVSIIGFDDSDLAILSEVPLTTIAHPKYKMGEKAAKMLLHLIEGKNVSHPLQYVYKPRLVIRDSCKAIR